MSDPIGGDQSQGDPTGGATPAEGQLYHLSDGNELPPTETLGGPREAPRNYNPEQQRDWVRLMLVTGLLVILGGLVLGAFLGLATEDVETQKNLIQVIGQFVAPITALIGAATGFYFGKEAAHNERPKVSRRGSRTVKRS